MEYRDTLGKVVGEVRGEESDGSWNRHFIEVLGEHNLTLATKLPSERDNRYPGGIPYQAPIPYGNVNGWPIPSYIVYRD